MQHVAARRRRAPVFVNQTLLELPATMAESSQDDAKLDLKVRDGNGAVTHFKVKKSTKFRKILTARPRRHFYANDAASYNPRRGTPAKRA